ncbi:hypothetical protein AAY473_000444 [Plecturocebus cupreus]
MSHRTQPHTDLFTLSSVRLPKALLNLFSPVYASRTPAYRVLLQRQRLQWLACYRCTWHSSSGSSEVPWPKAGREKSSSLLTRNKSEGNLRETVSYFVAKAGFKLLTSRDSPHPTLPKCWEYRPVLSATGNSI